MKSVENRCSKCGSTFAAQADLDEHIKTCKGGHEPPVRDKNHLSEIEGVTLPTGHSSFCSASILGL
jgi:glutamine amidotransferase PdxT